MAYKYSNSWLTPNNDVVIYRYFKEDKFKSLIETQSLYFNEILKYRKDDIKEGLIPHHNKRCIGRQYLSLTLRGQTIGVQKSIPKKYQIVNFTQKLTTVNCWNMSSSENKQMWNVYAKDKRAVLIKSNIKGLKESLVNTMRDIYIGKVTYVNHTNYIHRNSNPFSYAFLKDKESFEWEEEVRLISFDFESLECEALNAAMEIYEAKDFFDIDFDSKKGIDHIFVECDLKSLIKEIIVSPWAEDNYIQEIKETLLEYDIDVPVRKSDFEGGTNDKVMLEYL